MKIRAAPVDPNAVSVSAAFHQAFAYLSRHYGWAGDDLADVRAACRRDIGYRCYLVLLAGMVRDEWYAQNAANGFIRLAAFMAALGRDMAAEHAALVQQETQRLAATRPPHLTTTRGKSMTRHFNVQNHTVNLLADAGYAGAGVATGAEGAA